MASLPRRRSNEVDPCQGLSGSKWGRKSPKGGHEWESYDTGFATDRVRRPPP